MVRQRNQIKKRLTPYVLVLPFMLVMGFIFIGGIFQAVVQSFGYLPVFGMSEPTLSYYRQVFSDGRFISALQYTFYIAAVSSALSVILGTAVAFALYKTQRENRLSYTLYKTPIIMPHLVAVLLVFYIFSQTGIVSRLLFAANVIEDPNRFPLLVYDRLGVGVILVYLYKQIPFVTLTVFTVLKNLNKKYTQIAENLGAGRLQVLTSITLPLLAPSILSAFLITFAFNFGAFEVPFILGSPAKVTLPVLAYFNYTSASLTARPAAMVTNVVISGISLAMIWLYVLLFRFLTRRGLREGAL